VKVGAGAEGGREPACSTRSGKLARLRRARSRSTRSSIPTRGIADDPRLRRIPFVGSGLGWRAFVLMQHGQPVTIVDPEGDGRRRCVALFHDRGGGGGVPRARRARRAGGTRRDRRPASLRRARRELGAIARLAPGGHRARGATLWVDGDDVLLDSFSGLWRARDGTRFEPIEE
jgi:hypothetical protein